MARLETTTMKANGTVKRPEIKGRLPKESGVSETVHITIAPPKMRTASFTIRGTSAYVQHKFSAKAIAQMQAAQEGGSQSKSKKKREPKDFDALWKAATHRSDQGWCGIPCPSIRNAMIDACRLAQFKMTHAKCSLFVLTDGYDAEDRTPLFKITKGEPHQHTMPARNDSGVVDLRSRPMWDPGWEAVVRIQYDSDQFSEVDVANLLMRAGIQIGIGEGRPFSKNSAGLGWGTFELVGEEKKHGKDGPGS